MKTLIDPARIAEYEAERAAIMREFTPRLKAMASNDPMYPRVWNQRVGALQVLAAKYAMPQEGA